MPSWMIYTGGIATFLLAVSIIGTKVWRWVRGGAEVVSQFERTVPVMKRFTQAFYDNPEAAEILRQIAFEFKPNHGTSLRDVVDRIEGTARQMAHTLELMQERLTSYEQMVDLLKRINVKADTAAAGALLIAENLEAGHLRAEAEPFEIPGEAGDAQARRPPP